MVLFLFRQAKGLRLRAHSDFEVASLQREKVILGLKGYVLV